MHMLSQRVFNGADTFAALPSGPAEFFLLGNLNQHESVFPLTVLIKLIYLSFQPRLQHSFGPDLPHIWAV